MSLDFFKDDGVFLPMLNDSGRNNFYKQSIDLAAPGKTVCDIGAGTGLLSVLAVQAGAKKVIAVERNEARYRYLCDVLTRTGHSHSIEAVHGDFVQLDIAADVYVSETINTQIFGEDIVKLSNHANKHCGEFVPGGFRIWAEVYQNHPVFVLDLSHSEAHEFCPKITIDKNFVDRINADFFQQYSLQDTVFRANQLNRLFTMLDRFTDLKLKKLHSTDAIEIDMSQHIDEAAISVRVPSNFVDSLIVLRWQAFYKDVVLDDNRCWFGNVAKNIYKQFSTGADIVFTYVPTIRNWKVSY